jgi:hypothetical protein
MATVSVPKKPCSKCNKGAGVFTCDGCQQSFCRKHTDEHRQELSLQIDNIGQEHDVLQRDLNKELNLHSLLSRIDKWERESINKIQDVAKLVRDDLKKLIDQNKTDLKTSLNQLTNELQSSRDSEDYTELDLKRWIDQLNVLRQELEKPLTLNISCDDDKQSVIRLIKLSGQMESRSSDRSTHVSARSSQISAQSMSKDSERFEPMNQNIVLRRNGLVATRMGGIDPITQWIHGVQCYSSGIHHIRFRIEQKNSEYLFFGIKTHVRANSTKALYDSSINGWWDFEISITDGVSLGCSITSNIQTGDEITLVLDCDHTQIHFNHHQTKRNVKMHINLQKCPLPWQILVGFIIKGDSVRILGNNN